MTLEKPTLKPIDRQFEILFGKACTPIQADYYCGIINTSPRLFGNVDNDNLWKALGDSSIRANPDEGAVEYKYRPLVLDIAQEFRLHRLDDICERLINLNAGKLEWDAERVYTSESIICLLKRLIPHAHPKEEYLREFVETYSFLTPNTLNLIKMGTMPAARRYLMDIMYSIEEAHHFLQPHVATSDATAIEFDRYLSTLFTLTRSNLMRLQERNCRPSPLDAEQSWNMLSCFIITYALDFRPDQFANLLFIFSNYGEYEIIQLFRKCLGAGTKEEFRDLASCAGEKVFALLKKHNLTGRDYCADPWRRLLSEQPNYPTYFAGSPSDCFVKPTNMFN